MVPRVQKCPSPLPAHLDGQQLARLFETLSSWSTPRGLRDGAMILLCVARLGLRSGELVNLDLDDINWSDGTFRVGHPQNWVRSVVTVAKPMLVMP